MCLNSHVFGKARVRARVLVQVPARVFHRVNRVEMAMFPGPLVGAPRVVPDAALQMGNRRLAPGMYGQATFRAAAAQVVERGLGVVFLAGPKLMPQAS